MGMAKSGYTPWQAGLGVDYSWGMNNPEIFLKTVPSVHVLGAAFLLTLTGCVGYVDRPAQGSVYVEPYATFAVEDDYVYYPQYESYYSASRHQYAYREGNSWVARPAPRGSSVEALRASPSVKMDFHDSPANHHAAVVQQYPKNWNGAGGNQGQNEKQKDDQHGQNNGH